MLTITISGPPKSGKSMLANLIYRVLSDLIGVKVTLDDPDKQGNQREVTIAGIGSLLRKVCTGSGITIEVRLHSKDSLQRLK